MTTGGYNRAFQFCALLFVVATAQSVGCTTTGCTDIDTLTDAVVDMDGASDSGDE